MAGDGGPGEGPATGPGVGRAAPAPRRPVLDLLLASHPLPTLSVTALAGALAAGSGAGPRTAVVVLAVLAGQLSVGWSNDWLDARRDAAVGRRDKPAADGRIAPATVRTAAVTALAACVPLSLAWGPAAGAGHLLTVASAWAYNLGLKATPWSWAPYAFSFGLLPMAIALALPARPVAAWWAVAAGALLGIGAHGLNVLPDLLDDVATGVRGLPHRIGARATAIGSAAALLGATALVVLATPGGLTPPRAGALAVATLLAAVGGGLALRERGGRTPYLAAVAVAALAVGLLVAAPWTVA